MFIFTACFMIYLILMLNGFRSNKNVDERKPNQRRMKLTQRNFDNKHLVYSKYRRYIERTLNAEAEWKKQHTYSSCVSKQKFIVYRGKVLKFAPFIFLAAIFATSNSCVSENFTFICYTRPTSQVRKVSFSFSFSSLSFSQYEYVC